MSDPVTTPPGGILPNDGAGDANGAGGQAGNVIGGASQPNATVVPGELLKQPEVVSAIDRVRNEYGQKLAAATKAAEETQAKLTALERQGMDETQRLQAEHKEAMETVAALMAQNQQLQVGQYAIQKGAELGLGVELTALITGSTKEEVDQKAALALKLAEAARGTGQPSAGQPGQQGIPQGGNLPTPPTPANALLEQVNQTLAQRLLAQTQPGLMQPMQQGMPQSGAFSRMAGSDDAGEVYAALGLTSLTPPKAAGQG